MMTDDEIYVRMQMEDQLKFARAKIKTLTEELVALKTENDRLSALLNGEDVIKNSLKTTSEHINTSDE